MYVRVCNAEHITSDAPIEIQRALTNTSPIHIWKTETFSATESSFRPNVFLSRSFSFFLHCRSSILVKMAAATQMVEYFGYMTLNLC